jgi:hypothetical protein
VARWTLATALRIRRRLLRDDGVRANGKREDNVAINDEENAIFFGDIEIENLMAMPGDAGEFMTAQRRMPPIR